MVLQLFLSFVYPFWVSLEVLKWFDGEFLICWFLMFFGALVQSEFICFGFKGYLSGQLLACLENIELRKALTAVCSYSTRPPAVTYGS